MKNNKTKSKKNDAHIGRSHVAIAAHFRVAGVHGGSSKQKNRRDRSDTKLQLKNYE